MYMDQNYKNFFFNIYNNIYKTKCLLILINFFKLKFIE